MKRAELEVTAVSFHAYAYLHERYALLPHGASIGDGYGPRLVAKDAPALCLRHDSELDTPMNTKLIAVVGGLMVVGGQAMKVLEVLGQGWPVILSAAAQKTSATSTRRRRRARDSASLITPPCRPV
mgnify:CR=1 FL=1